MRNIGEGGNRLCRRPVRSSEAGPALPPSHWARTRLSTPPHPLVGCKAVDLTPHEGSYRSRSGTGEGKKKIDGGLERGGLGGRLATDRSLPRNQTCETVTVDVAAWRGPHFLTVSIPFLYFSKVFITKSELYLR